MTELELTGLLFKLADLSITGIKVTYDGGGDSGAIESIGYTARPCETPDDVDDEVDNYNPDLSLNDLDTSLYRQLEEFAQDTILNDIEDWWNNEGGWGELCICVPSGKYKINNHIRISETEDYYHEGDILSNSKNDD